MTDEEKKAIHDLKILRQGIGLLNCIPNIEKDEVDIEAIDTVLNLIEKQSKEIEELKETLKCTQNSWYEDAKIVDKIKAKIGKRMQKNNNTIHNAKLKHGKDYVYYDDVQEAKEENHICKEILQSLLEKE